MDQLGTSHLINKQNGISSSNQFTSHSVKQIFRSSSHLSSVEPLSEDIHNEEILLQSLQGVKHVAVSTSQNNSINLIISVEFLQSLLDVSIYLSKYI